MRSRRHGSPARRIPGAARPASPTSLVPLMAIVVLAATPPSLALSSDDPPAALFDAATIDPPPREPEVDLGTPDELGRFHDASACLTRRGGPARLVVKDGRVVFGQHAPGSTPARAHQIASGTRSFSGPLALQGSQKSPVTEEPCSIAIGPLE